MKKLTKKVFWILGLAYIIDRIFYPEKYKKKEPELVGELKYTTSTGETISKKIDFDVEAESAIANKIKNEGVPKYQSQIEDPDVWMKNRKKIDTLVARAERYCDKAGECKDREKAIGYYKQAIDIRNEVARIDPSPFNYRDLLSVCWASDLIDEVEKHLSEWLKEIPNDNDAHANLARLCVRNKEIEKAKSEYSKAISLNPRDHNYCDDLAKLYLDEGDYEKAIDVYRVPLEYFREDPYAGLNLYETYIKLCFKYNKTNQILKMIPEIFFKLDEMISGKRKASIYSAQDKEFYIYGRKKFGKNIGEMLEREVKTSLKDDNISKAKELVESFSDVIQNIQSNELQLMLNVLKAKTFRKEKRFNESWPLYNQTLQLCHENKQLSLLYSDMGDQLFEEDKIKGSLGMYLYALSLTNNFPAATSGLKKVLKKIDLKDSYESLVDVAKQIKDFDRIKDHIEKLQLKMP